MKRKTVSFKATVHNTQIRFTIPIDAVRKLGLEGKHEIYLILKSSPSGKPLFDDRHPMRSRHEIYGPRMRGKLKNGQLIYGLASRP